MRKLTRNKTVVFFISITMLLSMLVACGRDTKIQEYSEKTKKIFKDYSSTMEEVTATMEDYANQELTKDKAVSEFQEEKDKINALLDKFNTMEVPEEFDEAYPLYKEAFNESLRALDILIDGVSNQNTEKINEGIRVRDEAVEKMNDANKELEELAK